jgi:hypothetical protein
MYEFAQRLETTRLSVTIQSVEWIIPLTQSIHIIMIGILFVSILVIAMRVLGWMRMDQPVADVVGRFSRWIWSSLVVLTITGVILVIGEPVRELMSLSFWLKMGLLAIGITGAIGFRRAVSRNAVPPIGRAPEFSLAMRSAAVATVLLWLAIIFLGRAIAYDIEVWGALSLSPRA